MMRRWESVTLEGRGGGGGDFLSTYSVSTYTVSMSSVKNKKYISQHICHTAMVNGAFERSIKELSNCIITSPKYTWFQSKE